MPTPNAASLTNQRLDSARRLLNDLKSSNGEWYTKGHEVTATFLLKSALNGLLQEVKQSYQLSAELSVATLAQNATEKGVTVPVLEELSLLSKQDGSWLSQLEVSFDTYFQCNPNPMSVQSSDDLIIGASTSDQGRAIKSYLDALVEIVLRFREESSEY